MARFRYDSWTDAALAHTLSEPRFDVYLTDVGGLDVQAALDLYIWNLRAGATFYGPLAVFEVTLRNALHNELRALYGPCWFDDPGFMAMANGVLNGPRRVGSPTLELPDRTDVLGAVAKVRQRLTRDFRNRSSRNPPRYTNLEPAADDIVAALDFGYWTNLLNRDLDGALFVKGLFRAFPFFRSGTGIRKKPTRSDVARELNAIRRFRNRVMHFEPLFKGNLTAELERIVKVCSWIDGDAAEWMRYHSSLEELYRDRERPRHSF